MYINKVYGLCFDSVKHLTQNVTILSDHIKGIKFHFKMHC